jgi:hypothetical protein
MLIWSPGYATSSALTRSRVSGSRPKTESRFNYHAIVSPPTSKETNCVRRPTARSCVSAVTCTTAGRPSKTALASERSDELLSAIFGDDDRVSAARTVHRVIAQTIERCEQKYPRPLILRPVGPRQPATPPAAITRPSREWIRSYIESRAHEFGFDPAEITAQQERLRAARHDRVKRARAAIVTELVDRGARLVDIGAEMDNRSKPAVCYLDKKGLKARGFPRSTAGS